jgi:hypothetical protein
LTKLKSRAAKSTKTLMRIRTLHQRLVALTRAGAACAGRSQTIKLACIGMRCAYLVGYGRVAFEGSPEAVLAEQAHCTEWLGV